MDRAVAQAGRVMACNDIRAQQVLTACRAIGVGVPDEVAVLGVDNDEILCDCRTLLSPVSSQIPIASVSRRPRSWIKLLGESTRLRIT